MRGGVLRSAESGTGAFWTAWFLEIMAYCAVNGFALATGYLMEGRPFRYRKIVPLWLTVFFYALVLMAVGAVFFPGSVTVGNVFHLMPATTSLYWYFTAYFGLFFFIPFLNALIEAVPRRQYLLLLVTGFALFSLEHGVVLTGPDAFKMAGGYSLWWLMYLYLLGAGIKKYRLFHRMTPGKALLGFLAMALVTLLSKWGVSTLRDAEIPLLSKICQLYGEDRLVNYISPTVLGEAVFLMLFCLKVRVPAWGKRALKWLSPMVFQVYLIHVHFVTWNVAITDRFVWLASESPWMLTVQVLLCAAAVFALCIVLDLPRAWLFRRLNLSSRVDLLADWVTEKGRKLLPSEVFQ